MTCKFVRYDWISQLFHTPDCSSQNASLNHDSRQDNGGNHKFCGPHSINNYKSQYFAPIGALAGGCREINLIHYSALGWKLRKIRILYRSFEVYSAGQNDVRRNATQAFFPNQPSIRGSNQSHRVKTKDISHWFHPFRKAGGRKRFKSSLIFFAV